MIFAGILAGTMAFSMTACQNQAQQPDSSSTSQAGEGRLFTEPTVVKMVISSHASWPYDANWKMWQYFEEATGATFEVQAFPDADYATKVNLMMSTPDQLPDLMHFTHKLYYDFDEEAWHYGAAEPEMKDIVEYFLRLYNEGLVPPDYLTIPAKSWEELVSTDRGFMMPEYIVRLDFFNLANREQNPDYTWASMAPPKAEGGTAKLIKTNTDYSGYTICNTGDQQRIDNAFKVLDWMYSDEGCELLSWGKEGETYQVVDGKKEFILQDEATTPMAQYGVGTIGLYQRIDTAANEAIYSDEQVAEGHKALSYCEDRANPMEWLALNSEDEKAATELELTLRTYSEEMLSKFMTGQEPMSNWDDFQNNLKEMGVDELIGYYTKSYNQVMGK